MNEKIETAKTIISEYSKLSGAVKTVLSLFVMVTAPAIFIIVVEIRNPKVVTNVEFEKTVIERLDNLQGQITYNTLVDQSNWRRQHRMNDSIAKGLAGLESVVKDQSIITIANSSDALFRRMVPYLDRIEDNTYKTIIQLQKQEVLKRLDSVRIEARKIKNK